MFNKYYASLVIRTNMKKRYDDPDRMAEYSSVQSLCS